jgi:hypothetical protein
VTGVMSLDAMSVPGNEGAFIRRKWTRKWNGMEVPLFALAVE